MRRAISLVVGFLLLLAVFTGVRPANAATVIDTAWDWFAFGTAPNCTGSTVEVSDEDLRGVRYFRDGTELNGSVILPWDSSDKIIVEARLLPGYVLGDPDESLTTTITPDMLDCTLGEISAMFPGASGGLFSEPGPQLVCRTGTLTLDLGIYTDPGENQHIQDISIDWSLTRVGQQVPTLAGSATLQRSELWRFEIERHQALPTGTYELTVSAQDITEVNGHQIYFPSRQQFIVKDCITATVNCDQATFTNPVGSPPAWVGYTSREWHDDTNPDSNEDGWDKTVLVNPGTSETVDIAYKRNIYVNESGDLFQWEALVPGTGADDETKPFRFRSLAEGFRTHARPASCAVPQKLTATPTPRIAGVARVGSQLVGSAGTWSPAPVTLRYQWNRAGKAINGATGARYTLAAADRGQRISFTVTGLKAGYVTVAKTGSSQLRV